ncbi:NmrA family NAD(P)-binding protein [Lewinella sp. JB7]|uniref:NmrA family NAD(P)-binding protein n=1 Tax=Lewinella sp. JB7 TaxID=2962887 RepID=UPI0020C9A268|nr:NmrA family NAD(P)-binding protein [Lewinella sp. JB7]MCP9235398.1 NmrA family NAD(P)-binding protein [Lewinella sp. JB7]
MGDTSATIVLAGATGDLGSRIGREVLQLGGQLRVLVRSGTAERLTAWITDEVDVREVDFTDTQALREACRGGSCVVSALSGLEPVVVEIQSRLLDAAVGAGVPRFIPSDFSIDFTKLPRGTNRNLDLRKNFQYRLEAAPIRATSVLNGMFTHLLNEEAPFIVRPIRRVIYWGSADQPLDFTTIDDTATFTARAALDTEAPRFLRIAGESLSARQLRDAATAATGDNYRLLHVGGVGLLSTLIDVTRLIVPRRGEVYPPWQGMQYMRNMYSGRAKLSPLDNARYPDIRWTPVAEVLARAQSTGE